MTDRGRRALRRSVWWIGIVWLVMAPLLWGGRYALSLGCQMGIAILACQSYGWLLGRVGLLSFGHAVYTGAGAYAAVMAMRSYGSGGFEWPVFLVPLWSAVVAGGLAALVGRLCVRRGGMPFAMITLGLAELVSALAHMLPEWSGGESGLTVDRSGGPVWLGLTFGPVQQVYGLVLVHVLAVTWLLRHLEGTATGLLWAATRENAQRTAFLGHDPVRLRHSAFVLAGAIAGLSGGLAAVLFEIATPEVFEAHRSAAVLVFVVLGGAAHTAGHMLGGVLMVLAMVVLSTWTPAWALWVGWAFVAVVIAAPSGLWGAVESMRRNANLLFPSAERVRATVRRHASGVAALGAWVWWTESTYRLRNAELSEVGSPMEGSWLASFGAHPGVAVGAVVLSVIWWRGFQRASPSVSRWGPSVIGGASTTSVTSDALPWTVASALDPEVPPPSHPASLSVSDVHLRRGGVDILRGVDLEARPGECLAIIGPNGAGKTSLFHVLSGEVRATRGRVTLNGVRLDTMSPPRIRRAGLARSFQISKLFPTLTALDSVRCAVLGSGTCRAGGWRRLRADDASAREARRILASVGLGPHADQPSSALSYAGQRALEVALAVTGSAPVVLLDEPTAGMSRQETEAWIPVLKRLLRGRTLLIIEHDMNVAFDLADRVAVLVEGRVLACDTPEVIRAHPAVRAAYLSAPTLSGSADA